MARLSWGSLAKGRELPAAAFQVSPAWVEEYVESVEDGAIRTLGQGFVPPMAVAALALRYLLESVELPSGALHVGQELAFLAPIRAGQTLTAQAKVASSGQRAGWSLLAFDLRVENEGGKAILTGRATVTVPVSDQK